MIKGFSLLGGFSLLLQLPYSCKSVQIFHFFLTVSCMFVGQLHLGQLYVSRNLSISFMLSNHGI